MSSLYELSTQYKHKFAQLSESDFDEETIKDTLEAMEGEVAVKAANVLAYALNLDADAEALKGLITKLQGRLKAKERESEWMKEYLKSNMKLSGITEIEAIDGTFKAKLNIDRDMRLIVDSEASVDPKYRVEVPATFKLDNAKIKADIKAGIEVPGAHIEYRDRLEIK